MFNQTKNWYQRLSQYVDTSRAHYILGGLFFLEAIFFLPVDPLLLLYCFSRPKKSFFFALSAVIGSVAGGIGGYLLGSYLWSIAGEAIIYNSLLNTVIPAKTIVYLMDQFTKHSTWAVLVAGFTPIPYKAATLSAGFCNISLVSFVVCSAISRGARFFLYAIVIYFGGEQIKQHIGYFITGAIIIASLIFAGIMFW